MIRWTIAQAAEIRWWQRYLKNKNPSEYLGWKKAYWVKFCSDCGINCPPEAVCLDAGSSLAGIFTILNTQKVLAIDPLMDAYADKLPTFFEKNWYPNVQFANQSLEKLADTALYDWVFCVNVVNHVKDIQLVISNLWAAVKPGGTLLVSVDAHNYSFFKHLFRLVPLDILHPHQYDVCEYQRMFAEICQLTTEEIHTQQLKNEFFFGYYVLMLKKPTQ